MASNQMNVQMGEIPPAAHQEPLGYVLDAYGNPQPVYANPPPPVYGAPPMYPQYAQPQVIYVDEYGNPIPQQQQQVVIVDQYGNRQVGGPQQQTTTNMDCCACLIGSIACILCCGFLG